MTLPELAIKRHVTMLMIIVSLVVLGAVALFRLPLAFLPDVEEPHIFVRLPYPSASPDQVERMPPAEVFQKVQKGELLLVCAYETDVAFRAAKLKGAISFSQFTKLLPTLEWQQGVVFYCA